MPRTAENPKITNRTQRTKLAINREPYWHLITEGQHLGYRKLEQGGTWVARYYTREEGRRFQALGSTDDAVPHNGTNVLNFEQALKAANAWIANVIHSDGAEVDHKSSYTVAQAMDDYIADRESAKRKAKRRDRLIIEGHIKPTLGRIHLNRLTHGKVKAWRDVLATTAPRVRTRPGKPQAFRIIDANDPDVMRMRQATANRILTVLKAALNFAHEERRVSSKTAWESVKPYRKVDVPKVRFLTMDEVGALTPACESDFQKLVQGALVSGCRYGELTAMLVKAFDAGQGTVYVADSKNGESRYVELNDEGIAFFKRLTHGRDANEIMFLRSNDKPWKQSEQQRPMDAACEAAKLHGVTFHILRHTYASHAVMNGMPIAVLSEQLGHKDTRITERHYAHLCQTYKQKLIRENAPSFGFGASKPGPVLVTKAS
jgi:integrase